MLSSVKASKLLLVLLAITICGSVVVLRSQDHQKQHEGISHRHPMDQRLIDQQKKKQEERESQFPVVNYDALEDTGDPEKLAKRKVKNSRFDKRHFVSKDPTIRISASARTIEGYYVPALPTDQSSLIVLGDVLGAQAHISNDRGGVYTELTIRIIDVVNNTSSAQLAQGDQLTAEREGGIVRYSNGHKRLYQLAEEGMPRAGRQYVLFLRQIEQSQDYYVVTGYEVTSAGIVPVDTSSRFRVYEGNDIATFLNAVRTAAKQPRQATPVN